MHAAIIGITSAVALGAGAFIGASVHTQPQPGQPQPGQPQPGHPNPARPPAGQPGAQDMGQMLIQGLQNVEGCLGVETPQFPDGRQSIMAWFENKAAVERWYYSTPHQFMMGSLQQGMEGVGQSKPLRHVEDETLPVLVIATISFQGKPAAPGPIPFSQISIELYTPLPGGAFIADRLAPEGFEIPHMRNFTPGADGADSGEGSGE